MARSLWPGKQCTICTHVPFCGHCSKLFSVEHSYQNIGHKTPSAGWLCVQSLVRSLRFESVRVCHGALGYLLCVLAMEPSVIYSVCWSWSPRLSTLCVGHGALGYLLCVQSLVRSLRFESVRVCHGALGYLLCVLVMEPSVIYSVCWPWSPRLSTLCAEPRPQLEVWVSQGLPWSPRLSTLCVGQNSLTKSIPFRIFWRGWK